MREGFTSSFGAQISTELSNNWIRPGVYPCETESYNGFQQTLN